MHDAVKSVLQLITGHARAVIRGSYEDTRSITELTDCSRYHPEVTELAETFGLMAVKVEAREHALQQTITELETRKQKLQRTLQVREEASRLITWFAFGFSVYAFILAFLYSPQIYTTMRPQLIRWYGTSFTLLQLLLILAILRHGRASLARYGWTLHNSRPAVREALLSAGGMVILFAVLKVALTRSGMAFHGQPLLTTDVFDMFYFLYLVFAPVQEFLTRGVFQSAIERILTGPHATRMAIITTSLLFSAVHTTFSLPFALVSLFASLYWGHLFARYRTLAGPALSHVMLGVLFMLFGFWKPLAFEI